MRSAAVSPLDLNTAGASWNFVVAAPTTLEFIIIVDYR